MVKGKLKSGKGFYVGDLCYGLSDENYDKLWGDNGYEEGIFEDPETGLSIAVADTAYGDGCYYDNDNNEYGVDAGNISVIPYELADQNNRALRCMTFFDGEGECEVDFENGVFDITFQSGKTVHIDTGYNDDEEEEEDWETDDWPDPEDKDDERMWGDPSDPNTYDDSEED